MVQVNVSQTTDERKYRLQIVVISMMLIVLLGPIFAPVPRYLYRTLENSLETTSVMVNIIFAIAFLPILGVFYLYMRADNQSISDLIGIKKSPTAPLIVGTLVGIFWGVVFGMFAVIPIAEQQNLEFNIFEVNGLRVFLALFTAAIAVFEDVITRAFIMDRLEKLGYRPRYQIWLSALLFAFYHSIWGLNIFGFIASIIYGLILAQLYVSGKRSLLPVIFAHSLALLIGEPYLSYALILSV